MSWFEKSSEYDKLKKLVDSATTVAKASVSVTGLTGALKEQLTIWALIKEALKDGKISEKESEELNAILKAKMPGPHRFKD